MELEITYSKAFMTNKEKKEYLSLMLILRSQAFISELNRRNDFHSKTPKKLFKFRSFDEYAFDMLDNNYVYLSKAGDLDDPFDCLTNTNFDEIYEKDSFNLSEKMMNFIIDIVLKYTPKDGIDRKQILEMIDRSTVDGKVDNTIWMSELDEANKLSNEQKNVLLNVFTNFDPVITDITSDDRLKGLIKNLIKSKNTVGVCSLTTKRDNKVMWSHYADVYKGYCIEYEIPQIDEVINNLCPVVYTRKFDNNITKKIVEFVLENIIRQISGGEIITNIGCFTELTCTKDTDWCYQDEWRLIGDANTKCNKLKIKAIYLGFDISKENENKIISYSENLGFKVYKMDKPSGAKKITYHALKGEKDE